MKAMGIKQFKELLVDGTVFTEEERKEAVNRAIEEIDDIIKHIKFSFIVFKLIFNNLAKNIPTIS